MVSTIGFVSINPVLPYWDCLTPACPWTWSPAVWQPIWSTWLGKHFISDSAIYIKRKQKSIFLWYCLLSFVYINTAAIWSQTVQIQSEFCSFWDKTSCQPRVLFPSSMDPSPFLKHLFCKFTDSIHFWETLLFQLSRFKLLAQFLSYYSQVTACAILS